MSIFDMNSCTVRLRVISTKILFISSSMFGICGLNFMQLSFHFRESKAIFTLFAFHGDTRQLCLDVRI